MKIITEEMRFRKRLCEFALKYGVTKAAKRYHTNRQFVYRQLEKYDGTLRSLALQSRRPHSHTNAHTKEELTLIKQIYSRYGCDGLAEVYVQLRKRGYKRSYGSMLKQIKKIPKEKVKIRKGYTRHKEIRGQYPGDKVQVDIKYVPKECLLFDTIDKKYYQITAIDEFSRKRILEIVDEKSVTNTSKFIRTLEEKMGLKINTIQTDNGPEFVNNQIETNLPTLFELTLKDLGMIHSGIVPNRLNLCTTDGVVVRRIVDPFLRRLYPYYIGFDLCAQVVDNGMYIIREAVIDDKRLSSCRFRGVRIIRFIRIWIFRRFSVRIINRIVIWRTSIQPYSDEHR